MEVSLINPFLEATLDVFRTMAMLDINVGTPRLKEDNHAKGIVSGVIELHSDNYQGTLALSFEKNALFTIYRNMLGEEHNSIDEQILDLAGELTNMVCGGSKQRLSERGYHFDLTQPKILSGESHTIEHKDQLPVIQLPLTTDNDTRIFLEISMNR